MNVLELDGVVRRYRGAAGERRVLDGVSLTVAEGDLVAVTGPSGSGKSTLLNLCALLDAPDAGEIYLDGEPVGQLDDGRLSRLRGRQVATVFQSFALLPHRTVLDNVMFRFRYLTAPDCDGGRRRARECVEELGLAEVADQPARLLSGGEMQRVAIARAMALPPRLLVADEPTGNLDVGSATTVMTCFRRLNRERGVTILLATHNLALLGAGDRRLECGGGRLREVT